MWEKAIDYGAKVSYCLSPLSGGVAQLVRALPCHGRGYGFEPRRSRHFSMQNSGDFDSEFERRLQINKEARKEGGGGLGDVAPGPESLGPLAVEMDCGRIITFRLLPSS